MFRPKRPAFNQKEKAKIVDFTLKCSRDFIFILESYLRQCRLAGFNCRKHDRLSQLD